MRKIFISLNVQTCMHSNRLYQGSIQSLVEDILNCKLDFKDFQYRVADFQETKWCAANITIDNVNTH